MSSKKWLAAAAWALAPVVAAAAQKQAQPNPVDAAAPSGAVAYESAFRNYRTSSDASETPDKTWRSANEQVGRLAGHAGHMKDGEDNAVQSAASPEESSAAPQEGGAADHHKHH